MLFHNVIADALTLIAILNPFGNVPLFVSMSDGMDKEVRTKLFKTIAVTGFCIMLIFGLVGEFLMKNLYRIEMKELRIAGGFLLAGLAFRNILFSPKKSKDNDLLSLTPEEQVKQGVIPMAFPMMVGPGSLATMLIVKSQTGVVQSTMSLILAFAVIGFIMYIGTFIEKLLGKLVLYILSRVMQVFIMSIGVRILVSGILEVIEKMP